MGDRYADGIERLTRKAQKVAVDGYIDYLRRLKDVSECRHIDLEKARKALEKR